MAKFIEGNELNLEVEKLLKNAKEQIVLISPYIKLHEKYAFALKDKRENPDIKIIIVFGKNEEDISRSMRQEDFDFFKSFPNIEIRYEKRLHAKYYANESRAILSSMNLYSFSQDNNIEAGVLTKSGFLGRNSPKLLSTADDDVDSDSAKYFLKVIEYADLLFKNTPQYKKGMLGLTEKYDKSEIEVDKLTDFFANRTKYDNKPYKTSEQKSEKPVSKGEKTGYCIATGTEIPFNVKKPMSYEAYKIWNKEGGDTDKSQKFCHFSGETSNGDTSVNSPILRKNWKQAKEQFDL